MIHLKVPDMALHRFHLCEKIEVLAIPVHLLL